MDQNLQNNTGIEEKKTSRREALVLIGGLATLSFSSSRANADELTSLKSKTDYSGATVSLKEAELKSKTTNEVVTKLNTTLESFIKVANELYGLKNVEIGQDFQMNSDGSYTFEFNDPLKKIPSTVTIPALSKTIIQRDDNFHEKFLLLCALETACYHGGHRYEPEKQLNNRSYKSIAFMPNRTPATLELLSTIKRALDANNTNQSHLTKRFDEMIDGRANSFPYRKFPGDEFSNHGEDAINLISRFGSLFKRMQEDSTLKDSISLKEILNFSELMLSPRKNVHKFQSVDYGAEVRINVDPLNSGRLQSYQRVYKHVTGSETIPKLYGVIPNFGRPPGFIVKQSEEANAILIPYKHIIYDSGRVADKTTTGMLAMNNIYHKEDLGKNNLEYYPDNMLPDVGTALTSAYFFAAGFEAPQGQYELVLTKDEYLRLGTKLVNDQYVENMVKNNKHFMKLEQVEIDRANNKELSPIENRSLYLQRVKEGRSENQAAQELSREKHVRKLNRQAAKYNGK